MRRTPLLFGAALAAAAGAEGHEPFGGVTIAFVVSLVLLVLNGAFVAAEISLLAASRPRMEELAASGGSGALRALRSLTEMTTTFTAAQLGITIASLLLGAVAEPLGAALLLDIIPKSFGAAEAVAFVISLSVVVFVHMVVGEMLPKNLALEHPESVAIALSRPFAFFTMITRPLLVLLNLMGNSLVRLFGAIPVDDRGMGATPQELRDALRESGETGELSSTDVSILDAVLALEQRDARDVMTPRVDIVAVSVDADGRTVLDLAKRTGFTRFPVVGEDLDDVVGLVHVKDVLTGTRPQRLAVSGRLRPIVAVPEGRDLGSLLRDFRVERQHAVIVVDEFGSTAGLVTLEDVLEELIGDITDEFDPAGPSEVAGAGPGRWVIDGSLRKDELEALTGLRLPESRNETVSGWMAEESGRIPQAGDTASHEGWQLLVRAMHGRRAGRIIVSAPPPASPDMSDK